MTRESIERLSYVAAHKVLDLRPLESASIAGTQFATPGRRRTAIVDRVAEAIADVFEAATSESELQRLLAGEHAAERSE